ncbi:MAG: HAMP domain-containing histidine kinase [Desulfobacula sp.]|nr:HAMP domain-containing histidine kinase [Desulfobacula sp.]
MALHIEGKMMELKMSEEAEFYLEQIKNNSVPVVFRSKFTTVYFGQSALPVEIKEYVKIKNDGFYKIFPPKKGFWNESKYLIAIKSVQGRYDKLYIVRDREKLDKTLQRKKELFRILFFGFLSIIVLSLIIGLFTSRTLISPIKKLYQLVHKSDPENLPVNLSDNFKDDEVGALAKALENSMKRINEFIEREKQFTRDASHELRTPVTIIKGSVELMQQVSFDNQEKISKPLNRIERSVKDMETIIETFLWLSREKNNHGEVNNCRILSVVNNSIEENKYLLNGKNIDVKIDCENDPEIKVFEPVFKIAVTNLIRNAFHYTIEGNVLIKIKNEYVEISDTGEGIKSEDLNKITTPHIRGENSSGFGIGLAIVKQLCDRFSWKFEIESIAEKGTIARLIF